MEGREVDREINREVSREAKSLVINTASGSEVAIFFNNEVQTCLLYTSPSPRDQRGSRMPSSA